MIRHKGLSQEEVRRRIRHSEFTLAGNSVLKIYGTLGCGSGKRMKAENRVFFADEQDALHHGYRPCGNCMREAYQEWKQRGGRFPDLSSLDSN